MKLSESNHWVIPNMLMLKRNTVTTLFAAAIALILGLFSTVNAQDEEVLAIEWVDLMSKSDLDALMNPPPMNHDYGWESQLIDNPEAGAYRDALQSVDVNPDLIDKRVQLPGFVVPTAVNDDRKVTEFLLVPFFGACMHLPPPPPNQIIVVRFPDGVELESIYDAHEVRGTLRSEVIRDGDVVSAYTLDAESVELFEY